MANITNISWRSEFSNSGVGWGISTINVGKSSTGTYVSEIIFSSPTKMTEATITVAISFTEQSKPYNSYAYIRETQLANPVNVIPNAANVVSPKTSSGTAISDTWMSNSTVYYTFTNQTIKANTNYYVYLYKPTTASGAISNASAAISVSGKEVISATITVNHKKLEKNAWVVNKTTTETKECSIGDTYTVTPLTYTGYHCTGPTSFTISSTTNTFDVNYEGNIVKITLDGQGATTAPVPTETWHRYNTYTTKSYYYKDSALTTAMKNKWTLNTLPTKTGYTFGGFYTQTGGKGKQWMNSSGTYSGSPYANIYQDTTLYAKWTPKSYTLTFNPNGGQCSTATATVKYNSTYGTLPTPTRDGYTFLGWSFQQTNADTIILSTDTVLITANTTVYAQWQENSTGSSSKLFFKGQQVTTLLFKGTKVNSLNFKGHIIEL